MNELNPFAQEKLDWIFQREDDKVLRRESTNLEFKENFNFVSLPEYGKIGASFANRKGGYIVFGIKDRPHLLLGMQNEQFLDLNIERATTLFNEYFSPSLKWDLHLYEIDGKKFGLLYFFESLNKPVIAVKNNDRYRFTEGDIHYRYFGQTRKIRHSELSEMIENKIRKEKDDWLAFLKNALQFKPDSVLLLDLESGTIDSNNHPVLIDERIIDKLNFIKEGEFSETEGAPTLKLIGEITETTQTHNARIIERIVPEHVAITTEQLLDAFFNQNCDNPIEYLKQFCYESAVYLPIWHFILRSGKSIDEMEEFWNSLNDVKEATRTKLLQRLANDDVNSYGIGTLIDINAEVELSDVETFNNFIDTKRQDLNFPSSRTITVERSSFYHVIINNNEQQIPEEIINQKARPLFEAISHLPVQVMVDKKEWILNTLSFIHSSRLANDFITNYRKSICSVDIKLSKSQIE